MLHKISEDALQIPTWTSNLVLWLVNSGQNQGSFENCCGLTGYSQGLILGCGIVLSTYDDLCATVDIIME